MEIKSQAASTGRKNIQNPVDDAAYNHTSRFKSFRADHGDHAQCNVASESQTIYALEDGSAG